MATPKQNFIGKILASKKSTEGRLQSVGKQIRKNIDQGQADHKSGKADYYASINPLKGTVAAFRSGKPY